MAGSAAPAHPRRGRLVAGLALLVFAAIAWFAVPHGIGVSWRECDTQAIARNFVDDAPTQGFDPLRPRIDWRGDTDGAVECEFPLYQLAIAGVLALSERDAEWPGRLLSLLAMLWAGWSVHELLRWRASPAGALAGLLTFLAAGSSLMLATRVMPDALSLAFAAASLAAFTRYLTLGAGVSLTLSMAALAAAALQKPLALQVGWIMFGWTVFVAPRRLRDARLWLGWLAVVGVTAAWLLHAKGLYEETGLTFGVLGGGDTKFPALAHVLSPWINAHLGWTTVQYGLSALGLFAAAVLLLRRRFDALDACMVGAAVAGLYLSLRYSYHEGMGPHYHTFAALAGAWCVARAWPANATSWRTAPLVFTAFAVAIAAQVTWRASIERSSRTEVISSPLMDVAASIRALTAPGERIVVRAQKPRFDPFWRRRNNYEEPSLLYQAALQGWVLPQDGFDVETLADLQARGANLVYDCVAGERGEAQRWLDEHGDVVFEAGDLRLHRLHSAQ
jgi:hypothetical protein